VTDDPDHPLPPADRAALAWCAALGVGSCRWRFPDPDEADESGFLAVGGDLSPATLVYAYCHGLFPMPVGLRRRLGWWSPDPRAVLPLDHFAPSRSLRRSVRRYEVRVDTAFEEVMRRCGDPRRPHGWITEAFVAAYDVLHRLGVAHSVETWLDGELVGGLYGVALGSFFAGESMFHRATDASKVALVHLVELRRDLPASLLDVQWLTPHLASLGAIEIPRHEYLERLDASLLASLPEEGRR